MKRIALMILALCTAMFAASCGSGNSGKKVHTYYASDYIELYAEGVDGEGTIDYKPKDNFSNRINKDIYGGKATDEDYIEISAALLSYVQLSPVTDITDLSNGDEIEVGITVDNEALKPYGIAFKEDSTVHYTVSGLIKAEEGIKDEDIWKDVQITIPTEDWMHNPQTEGNIIMSDLDIKYTGNADLKGIRFDACIVGDNGAVFKNNDVLEITCSYTYNGVQIHSTYQYTVTGFPEYLKGKFDSAELDDLFDSKLPEFLEDKGYVEGATDRKEYLFKDTDDKEKEYTFKGISSITPMEHIVYADGYFKDQSGYAVIYAVVFSLEDSSGNVLDSDNIYFAVSQNNIAQFNDGTLVFNEEGIKCDNIAHVDFGPYNIGADYSVIHDFFVNEHSQIDHNSINVLYTDYEE